MSSDYSLWWFSHFLLKYDQWENRVQTDSEYKQTALLIYLYCHHSILTQDNHKTKSKYGFLTLDNLTEPGFATNWDDMDEITCYAIGVADSLSDAVHLRNQSLSLSSLFIFHIDTAISAS